MPNPEQKPKFETKSFAVEKISDPEVKAKSKELFAKLSPESRQKFYQAFKTVRQTVGDYGLDVEKYSVYLDQSEEANGTYHASFDGDSYVTLNAEYVEKAEEVRIVKTLLHELVGHALNSYNESKVSEDRGSYRSGLRFSTETSPVKYTIHTPYIRHIQEILQNPEAQPLGRDDRKILSFLQQSLELDSYEEVAGAVAYHLDQQDQKLLANNQQATLTLNLPRQEREVGLALNEGVTEYLAILMAADGDDEVANKLLSTSAYEDWVGEILALENYLVESTPTDVGEFSQCLWEAQRLGRPKLIQQFIEEKTGVRLSFQDIFQCDFDALYEARP